MADSVSSMEWVKERGEGSGGLGVCSGEEKGEGAGRAPGAAVVEGDDSPAGATDGLGKIEILFVAREPVEEENDWVRPGARCNVGDGIEGRAVAGDLEGCEGGGIGGVVRGVGGDGCRNLCCDGQSRAEQSCREDES